MRIEVVAEPVHSSSSINEIARQHGVPVPCESNLPVSLADPESTWVIAQGTVDLFLLETRDGRPQAAPEHLLRAEAGRLMPGVATSTEDETCLELIAKGRPGTILKQVPTSELARASPNELAREVDAWVTSVTEALCRFSSSRPRPTALVEPQAAADVEPGTLAVRRGVVWLSQPPLGKSLFLGMLDSAELGGEESWLALTPNGWLSLFESASLRAESSETLAQRGALLPALTSFHSLALALERLNRRLAVVDQANLERARSTSRQADVSSARRRLFNIYDEPLEQDEGLGEQYLLHALRIIGKKEGINFKLPASGASKDNQVDLADILDASGVRARQVSLRPEDRWWHGDSNAILAFTSQDGLPVVLLPTPFGRYRQIDPVTKRSQAVTKASASALKKQAWVFYPPLPKESATPADLWRIGVRGSGADLIRLTLAGIPGGLLQLLPALALGFVAHHLVTGGSATAIYTALVALAGLGLIGALLHLLQSTALTRLENRSTTRIEAAFWNRLMRLPTSILRRHPAGDLAMTGMTFQGLREGAQGAVAGSVLALLFLLPVFAVIFFVDAALGGIALAFSIASITVTVLFGMRQISPHGRMIAAVRKVVGRLFQIVAGIAKLRVENAEGSAFSAWARDYRDQKRAELELGRLEGHLQAFAAALPFLAGAVLLLFASMGAGAPMPVADFLVVYIVFVTFQNAVARFGGQLSTLSATLPAFEQMRPLLAAIPETEAEGQSVDHLGGEILFDHVSFRYRADEPLILDDVTIHARAGEFIAIAGESGAGKSTLFRLALGLDQPASGAVYYDGRDLQLLNLKQVRRKVGAVPQAVQLHPQDLWDNIVAHHEQATSDEVWHMAEVADMKREIKAMPMGMLTPVGTSGSVLSGGESQRITIARSLMRDPQVVLLDEATNWLDNQSQAQVMQNLAALTSTRIVIAHRLSTLLQADRIYVLSKGKIVQSGTFQDLMDEAGVFRELVRRQIA